MFCDGRRTCCALNDARVAQRRRTKCALNDAQDARSSRALLLLLEATHAACERSALLMYTYCYDFTNVGKCSQANDMPNDNAHEKYLKGKKFSKH
jgi:hypothetical protein